MSCLVKPFELTVKGRDTDRNGRNFCGVTPSRLTNDIVFNDRYLTRYSRKMGEAIFTRTFFVGLAQPHALILRRGSRSTSTTRGCSKDRMISVVIRWAQLCNLNCRLHTNTLLASHKKQRPKSKTEKTSHTHAHTLSLSAGINVPPCQSAKAIPNPSVLRSIRQRLSARCCWLPLPHSDNLADSFQQNSS